MKIKLSKSQWQKVGEKAKWMKTAQNEDLTDDTTAESLISSIENAVFNLKYQNVGLIKSMEKQTGMLKKAIKLMRDFIVLCEKQKDY